MEVLVNATRILLSQIVVLLALPAAWPGFLEAGGMINFVIEGKKIRFEINLAVAAREKLLIRSSLLRLAVRTIGTIHGKDQTMKTGKANVGIGRRRVPVHIRSPLVAQAQADRDHHAHLCRRAGAGGNGLHRVGMDEPAADDGPGSAAHAEVLADNCKTAITFHDAADAGTCLRTVGAVPSIMAVCVYTREGELFAMYVRQGTIPLLPPQQTPHRDYRFDRESLVITRPILLNGIPIGTVCLRGSRPVYLRLRCSILVIVGTVFLSSLAAYLISARLQRLISLPILRLADVVRLVSEKKVYTVRVESASHDEVGLLIQAFNEMLGQIQQRDVALVEANEQLEARVSADRPVAEHQ